MISKAKKQSALLADLNALDEQQKLSPEDGKVHVLGEPSATLPLWRRVDRQYWWNEWLSKPLLDAGVSTSVAILPPPKAEVADIAAYIRAADDAGLLPDSTLRHPTRAGGD